MVKKTRKKPVRKPARKSAKGPGKKAARKQGADHRANTKAKAGSKNARRKAARGPKSAAKRPAATPPKKGAKRSTKNVTRKVAARGRPLRIKKHRGPLQLGLPLQMPFAFGADAYAERPVSTPADEPEGKKPARVEPEAEQAALFE